MGTRTYSRRGNMLAAVDIFGNPIPDRAPARPTTPAVRPLATVQYLGNPALVKNAQEKLNNVPVNTTLNYEQVFVTDGNGKLLYSNNGQHTSVEVLPDPQLANYDTLMQQKVHVTHNHPYVRPLSSPDFYQMVKQGFGSIEARTIPMEPDQRLFINAVFQNLLDNPDSFKGTGTDPEFDRIARSFIKDMLAHPDALNLKFTLAQGPDTRSKSARQHAANQIMDEFTDSMDKIRKMNFVPNFPHVMWDVTTSGNRRIAAMSFEAQQQYMMDAVELLTQHMMFVRVAETGNTSSYRQTNPYSYGMTILP